MLMTKSPSITRSTLVSSPTDSTIHIWCVRKTVSSSAVSPRPSAREAHARLAPEPAAARAVVGGERLLRHVERRLRRQGRRGELVAPGEGQLLHR